jgi:hypothetical protein
MELIVSGEFLLERFSGKGGWTFARVPIAILPSARSFGMIRVSGKIDDFEFERKHLMPMGDGFLFLPISKEIRKAIGKEAGDQVSLRLFRDEIPKGIPEELIACLQDDPGKYELFQRLSEADQTYWIAFIYGADSEETKASRIVKLLSHLDHFA